VTIVLVAAAAIGVTLGVLGGGGSIMTVPALVYLGKLDPKTAIAISLLVVGAAAFVGAVQRRRHVDWRHGMLFASAGAVGAFGGGLLAQYIPGTVLLVLFAAIMLATSVAMLRSGTEVDTSAQPPRKVPAMFILAEGALVGAITGLVGAGGGFLIVPALVLLTGMPMKRAVPTSLAIIAVKSLAGFAGYAAHVQIPWALAGGVVGVASIGVLAGQPLAKRIPEKGLRQAFGWFVLLAGLFILATELPDTLRNAAWFQQLFVQRWPWWIGGASIATVALGLLYSQNKLLGVSTGISELCSLDRKVLARSWRLPFLVGIPLGGLAAALLAGQQPRLTLAGFASLWGQDPWLQVPVLLVGGVLIGYGARWAGGCTSGHGIVGTAQRAPSSLLATATFMASGIATMFILNSIL
jgi:uncharacterized membrane protein YfcA/uncharacterized membrane protein YedE/YeeE